MYIIFFQAREPDVFLGFLLTCNVKVSFKENVLNHVQNHHT